MGCDCNSTVATHLKLLLVVLPLSLVTFMDNLMNRDDLATILITSLVLLALNAVAGAIILSLFCFLHRLNSYGRTR